MADDFDLEALAFVEQTFYDAGYQDGYAHGRIHGLIEGRALGREKGFEIWEELGFYEGFATTWKAIGALHPREDDRTALHIDHLLDYISRFPRVNPSAADTASDIDISKLLRQIRSRYKMLCGSLGVRPRPRVIGEDAPPSLDVGDDPERVRPIHDVSVWKLDNGRDLSF